MAIPISPLPSGYSRGHSKIELFISARGLKKMDLLSDSDPFAIVSMLYSDGKSEFISKTEVISDTSNPDFTTPVVVDFYFEELQSISVTFYDEDKKGSANLADHDYIGEASFTLSGLMRTQGNILNLPLTRKGISGNYGKLMIRGEEVSECNDFLTLQLRAEKLVNKDGIFGKSDPFYKILRSREDGSWMPVFTSQTIMNNLNPIWQPQVIPVQSICNGDYERPLKIEIWDWESSGRHQYMGSFQTSLRELTESVGAQDFEVIEEEKRAKKKSYQNSGKVKAMSAGIRRDVSFLDFIKGGCEINLVIAIDFTASNGYPMRLDSLHYIDPTRQTLNSYQKAILAVGEILCNYDTDQRFPVFGFGSKLPSGVCHCFPLHGPEGSVYGVEGIMMAYENAIRQVELSGPTLFTPVITNVMRSIYGRCNQVQQQYTILLIITDGVINDMSQTIDTIVEASYYPLSIIIIGVGNADFTLMHQLDADNTILVSSRHKQAAGDIVQFVAFNEYSTHHYSKLAKDTLAEIPNQLLSFFIRNNIVPNTPLVDHNSAMQSALAPLAPFAVTHQGKEELPSYYEATQHIECKK